MPYVRINLAEYPSPEALQKNSDSINAAAQSIFPDIMLVAGINLTETSQMAISIYPDKEAADKALAQRDSHQKTQDIELVMSHAGDLSFFSMQENRLNHKESRLELNEGTEISVSYALKLSLYCL